MDRELIKERDGDSARNSSMKTAAVVSGGAGKPQAAGRLSKEPNWEVQMKQMKR